MRRHRHLSGTLMSCWHLDCRTWRAGSTPLSEKRACGTSASSVDRDSPKWRWNVAAGRDDAGTEPPDDTATR